MKISFKLNGIRLDLDVPVGITLLDLLRGEGIFSVKSGGCQHGECGACTVLLDGKPVNSCKLLAAQADGHSIVTTEALGEHPEKGWKKTSGLHPLQQAFIECGAIQCGYCTPAMLLAAKALLAHNSHPTDEDVRNALSGILCRCTGYLKPVEAILRAATILQREEDLFSADKSNQLPNDCAETSHKPENEKPKWSQPGCTNTLTQVIPEIWITPRPQTYKQIGQSVPKVDAVKLVQGKPAFTADVEMRGMLIAKVLHSPHAHAKIINIDTSKALALPGVAAVLTWKDIPRVVYSTAGQSDPIPGPLDSFSLDNKVRFVGDRVAFIAAETNEIAEHALRLIDVDYELLPVLIDPGESMDKGAPIIHDESEYVPFAESDPIKNLAARIEIEIGNVEQGFKEADKIYEETYTVPKVQQAHIETHVVITYWDEDDRLIIRSSTQVPFHARRVLAPILGIPVKRIRVIKPRIGGGFGGKQEVLIEDVAAHLTIATGRPVKFEYTRDEEFTAARSRHPMKIWMKTGVKKDGTITANSMKCLSDTGAYGCHALTVTGNTGHKAMALYVGDDQYRKSPNIQFHADIVYTNTPPSGAFRGYGGPQGFWAVERQMENIARDLGMDSLEFRLKNCLRPGELHPFSTAWSEGREPKPEIIHTVGIEQCVSQAKAAIGWDAKYGNPDWHLVPGKPHLRRGIGAALMMHGTAIPYLDMGAASIKMNDDGSFNLLIGATDLGTGSDTILAQMAAEVLGCEVDDICVYSSDTDFTPFDKGAYASSTTYISGGAVIKAAKNVAERIRARAARMLTDKSTGVGLSSNDITLEDRKATAPDGRFVTLKQVALNSLHHTDQEQIMGTASFVSPSSPPPFAAQFVELLVDIETGRVEVKKMVMAVDAGVIVNPITASGQIEGGMVQALGYAVAEEMTYDEKGRPHQTDFVDYHILRSDEIPDLQTIFIETFEPSHPFGIKAIAEIPMDGVAPAVGNAILDAHGIYLNEIPITPDRVWRAIHNSMSRK